MGREWRNRCGKRVGSCGNGMEGQYFLLEEGGRAVVGRGWRCSTYVGRGWKGSCGKRVEGQYPLWEEGGGTVPLVGREWKGSCGKRVKRQYPLREEGGGPVVGRGWRIEKQSGATTGHSAAYHIDSRSKECDRNYFVVYLL